jgi:hypothetical protein
MSGRPGNGIARRRAMPQLDDRTKGRIGWSRQRANRSVEPRAGTVGRAKGHIGRPDSRKLVG